MLLTYIIKTVQLLELLVMVVVVVIVVVEMEIVYPEIVPQGLEL